MDKSQLQPRRRRRPMRSCWECRRRKLKCDRSNPCAHCVRHKTQCVFATHAGAAASEMSRTRRPAPASTGGTPIGSTPNAPATVPSSDSGYGGSARTGTPPSSLPSATGPSRVLADAAASAHPQQVYPSPDASAASARAVQSAGVASSLSANTPSSSSSDPIHALVERIQRLEDSYSTVSSRHADSVESPAGPVVEPRGPQPGSAEHHTYAPRGDNVETPQDWQDVVKTKSRNLGRTRRLGDAPDFAPIIQCYSAMLGTTSKDVVSREPAVQALLVEGGALLAESKHMAQQLKRGRPSRLPPTPSATPRLGDYLVPPSRERADAMARLYFACFESTYRILHAPTFWADYERYWQAPGSVTNAVYLQILLVVAIGSSLHDHGDSNAVLDNIEVSRPCIYAAENWLAGPLEKDRLNIGGFQVYCLTILARQIFSVGGDLVWMSMGSLLHRAMQCGLHREPRHLPGVSLFHAELRRRLWATILDMAVQASLDASMPPRIALDEFDIEPPSNINDDEIDAATTRLVPHPRTTFTSTSVQLALLDTLPLRLRIVQYLNGLHSDHSYASVLALSAQLSSALRMCNSLGVAGAQPDRDPNAAPTAASSPSSVTPFQCNLLDFLVRRFMIPLHMFFATQARASPVFHYSLAASLDAALALVSPVTPTGAAPPSCRNDNVDNDAVLFGRLLSVAGGLFREGFRAALTAISLELLVHVTTQQANGTLHRAPQHRVLLKAVVRDLVALAERRTRHGDTNIKGYMFLNMVLAQVDATEAGGRPGDGAFETALARGAVESLQFCRDEIKGRADAMVLLGGEEMEFDADGLDLAGNMDFEAFELDWNWQSLLATGQPDGTNS